MKTITNPCETCTKIPTDKLMVRSPRFVSLALGRGALEAYYSLRTPAQVGLQQDPDRLSTLIVPRGEVAAAEACFKSCAGNPGGDTCQASSEFFDHIKGTRVFNSYGFNPLERLIKG